MCSTVHSKSTHEHTCDAGFFENKIGDDGIQTKSKMQRMATDTQKKDCNAFFLGRVHRYKICKFGGSNLIVIKTQTHLTLNRLLAFILLECCKKSQINVPIVIVGGFFLPFSSHGLHV